MRARENVDEPGAAHASVALGRGGGVGGWSRRSVERSQVLVHALAPMTFACTARSGPRRFVGGLVRVHWKEEVHYWCS